MGSLFAAGHSLLAVRTWVFRRGFGDLVCLIYLLSLQQRERGCKLIWAAHVSIRSQAAAFILARIA